MRQMPRHLRDNRILEMIGLSPRECAGRIQAFARDRGFDLCRIVAPGVPTHAEFFRRWLARGDGASMQYLHRFVDRREDPARLLGSGGGRSIIVLGVDYYQFALDRTIRDDPARGVIASYAWGRDYHDVIRPALFEVDAFVRTLSGRREEAKCLVDTGPVLERDWAQASGLGFLGKNCCVIHPDRGSWLFLATIVVPELLEPDCVDSDGLSRPAHDVLDGLPRDTHFGFWELQPVSAGPPIEGTCGRCTRCMDACPTDAFVGPFHLDSRRCISYWTIETQEPIPRELRPQFGNRIFGCDICQEVCPWNADLPPRTTRFAALSAMRERTAPRLLDGFSSDHPYWLDERAFAQQFKGSPILRAKRIGMLRNVCVALGNWHAPAAVPALSLAAVDPAPVVRAHAAWALGQVWRQTGSADSRTALERLQTEDSAADVRIEADIALRGART
jgi:epoxyqueuosine reductase